MAKKTTPAVTAIAGELKRLEEQLGRFKDLVNLVNQWNQEICLSLLPMVREMIRANYNAMHFGTLASGKKNSYRPTGNLFKAAVETCDMIVGKKGFVIRMGKGFERDVYIRASVFRSYRDFFKLSPQDQQKLQDAYIPKLQAKLDAMK